MAKKPEFTSAGASPNGPHGSATATVSSARTIGGENRIVAGSRVTARIAIAPIASPLRARLFSVGAALLSPDEIALDGSTPIRLHDHCHRLDRTGRGAPQAAWALGKVRPFPFLGIALQRQHEALPRRRARPVRTDRMCSTTARTRWTIRSDVAPDGFAADCGRSRRQRCALVQVDALDGVCHPSGLPSRDSKRQIDVGGAERPTLNRPDTVPEKRPQDIERPMRCEQRSAPWI